MRTRSEMYCYFLGVLLGVIVSNLAWIYAVRS